jgi:hypothetical protein
MPNIASRRQFVLRAIGFALAGMILVPAQSPASCQTDPDARGPSIVSVENCGLLFTDNRAGVSGVDAGYSIALNHEVLWLFGDVFLQDNCSPTKTYVGAVSNCGLIVSKRPGVSALRDYTFLKDAQTGLARQLLGNSPGVEPNIRYWPFGGWYDAANRRIYLYYARIHTTGTGPLDFQSEGYGLAAADATRSTQIEFNAIPAGRDGKIWWPETAGGSVYGNAVVQNCSDRYVYVAGMRADKQRRWGRMARVPRERIGDRSAYEYYAGGGEHPVWVRRPDKAADVAGLADFPTELSISYNSYLGGYLAVHTLGIFEQVRLSFASRPWGPYHTIAEISTPHRAFAKAWCYAGKEHPELAEERGRIVYVTYVDSDRYWLKLLKVTLQAGKHAGR